MKRLFFYIIIIQLIASCKFDSELKQEFIEYTGPIMEADSSKIIFSDSAVVRVIVNGVKEYTYENQDKEFPKGIFIEFYQPDGTLSSTLEANSAYFFQETNLYKAEGDVEVIGYVQPQTLNTEELYWNPDSKEIYTDQFVRIETKDQISTGKGMTAKQDFSTYRILNPAGTIYLDDDENDSTEQQSTPPKRINSQPMERKIDTTEKREVLNPRELKVKPEIRDNRNAN